MKRIFDIGRNVFAAACYGLCGAVWLYRGFLKEPQVNRFYVALGVMWLTGAVIWIVRTLRKLHGASRETKETTDETNHV